MTRGNQPPKGLREKYSRQRSNFQCKGPEAGTPGCEEQQGPNDQSMSAEGGTVEIRSDHVLFKPPQRFGMHSKCTGQPLEDYKGVA